MSAFLGFCHVSGGDAPSRLVAAAFCADRSKFEALVGAALAAQGYRLDWAEDVLPAGPWVARHPAAGGAALARLVHEGRHVALGPMTPLGGADATPEEDQNWLHVEEIGPITPLDAQFGVHPKKSVPDALHDVLFGQPEPTEAERAALGEDMPPLATYAVLDAAKMPYLLTGLLESSGLRHQSLFQGAAQEDLGEHAPYLVELKDGNDFTRRLFTGPEGVGGLWEKELGIFIRSRGGFDALRRHLRKFTRVQDEEGKWYYFRFWEATTISVSAKIVENDVLANTIYSSIFVRSSVLSKAGTSSFTISSWISERRDNDRRLHPVDHQLFAYSEYMKTAEKIALWIKETYSPEDPLPDIVNYCKREIGKMYDAGINQQYALLYFLAGQYLQALRPAKRFPDFKSVAAQREFSQGERSEIFLAETLKVIGTPKEKSD